MNHKKTMQELEKVALRIVSTETEVSKLCKEYIEDGVTHMLEAQTADVYNHLIRAFNGAHYNWKNSFMAFCSKYLPLTSDNKVTGMMRFSREKMLSQAKAAKLDGIPQGNDKPSEEFLVKYAGLLTSILATSGRVMDALPKPEAKAKPVLTHAQKIEKLQKFAKRIGIENTALPAEKYNNQATAVSPTVEKVKDTDISMAEVVSALQSADDVTINLIMAILYDVDDATRQAITAMIEATNTANAA